MKQTIVRILVASALALAPVAAIAQNATPHDHTPVVHDHTPTVHDHSSAPAPRH